MRRPPANTIGADAYIDNEIGYQWATSVQNLLAKVSGEGSERYKNFVVQVKDYLAYSPVLRAQGVLKAAKDDHEHVYLFTLRRLIEAEVFDEFLEQAEHPFRASYHPPAAVVAGPVLEDGLRKLCTVHVIALPTQPKLDSMNSELAKAGVYDKLVQKRITTLADLRNKAAHGRWSEFTGSDVKEMLEATRRFMENQFS